MPIADSAETAKIANWRSSPFNRWAFRNVPKLIASDRIENDSKTFGRSPPARNRSKISN